MDTKEAVAHVGINFFTDGIRKIAIRIMDMISDKGIQNIQEMATKVIDKTEYNKVVSRMAPKDRDLLRIFERESIDAKCSDEIIGVLNDRLFKIADETAELNYMVDFANTPHNMSLLSNKERRRHFINSTGSDKLIDLASDRKLPVKEFVGRWIVGEGGDLLVAGLRNRWVQGLGAALTIRMILISLIIIVGFLFFDPTLGITLLATAVGLIIVLNPKFWLDLVTGPKSRLVPRLVILLVILLVGHKLAPEFYGNTVEALNSETNVPIIEKALNCTFFLEKTEETHPGQCNNNPTTAEAADRGFDGNWNKSLTHDWEKGPLSYEIKAPTYTMVREIMGNCSASVNCVLEFTDPQDEWWAEYDGKKHLVSKIPNGDLRLSTTISFTQKSGRPNVPLVLTIYRIGVDVNIL